MGSSSSGLSEVNHLFVDAQKFSLIHIIHHEIRGMELCISYFTFIRMSHTYILFPFI